MSFKTTLVQLLCRKGDLFFCQCVPDLIQTVWKEGQFRAMAGVCVGVCVGCRGRAGVGSGQQLLIQVCSRGAQHIIGRC